LLKQPRRRIISLLLHGPCEVVKGAGDFYRVPKRSPDFEAPFMESARLPEILAPQRGQTEKVQRLRGKLLIRAVFGNRKRLFDKRPGAVKLILEQRHEAGANQSFGT